MVLRDPAGDVHRRSSRPASTRAAACAATPATPTAGPVFVYVRDGRILRITPIEFDDDDAEPWTIEARGRSFTPPRKTTVNSHTLAWKSLIYSPDRLLYPMKRVDFDPDGERNPQNRGTSGYERISWDEALDLVASRDQAGQARPRPRRDHERQRFAPHLGRARLLAERPHPLLQHDRLDADRAQSGQLGGLVLGRLAPLGPDRPQRRRRDLRHRRGPAEARRDGRVLVLGPGGDERRLRRPRRHRPPAVAQGARHPLRAHRPVPQPHRAVPRRQVDRPPAGHGQRHGPRHRPRVDDRGPVRQGVRGRAHRRLREVARLRPRRGGRRAQDAGVAGGGDRRPRARRACARARLGHAARPTSPPAASSASAAPAARPPAATGRAAWSA